MPTIFRSLNGRVWRAALLLAGMVSLVWGQQNQFVQRSGGDLTLNGSTFRFGGADSYPLMLSPQPQVDQVLDAVANSNLAVVRMWAFCDGTPCAGGSFYLQSWNTSTNAPAYNDTITGLGNVDYAIAKAGQLGIKLIIPLANNWPDYGGMDVYVGWAKDQHHDQFYTDQTIQQWYKSWVSHVLNHVNSITGLAYKDDPTIMAWELANEPECGGSGLPTSGTCTNQTIIDWITEMSAYIKTVDTNHLVSVGDEGFFCEPGTTDYFTDCSNGVDSQGFSSVPDVDLVGFHLYPDLWGQSIPWTESFIQQHQAEAATLDKPLYMGEFGLESNNAKVLVYNDWTNLLYNGVGSGAMFWVVLPGSYAPSGAEGSSELNLGFTEYAGSPILSLMGDFDGIMSGSTQPLPPVAGYQWANTNSGAVATLDVLSNAVAYGGATIDPTTLTLGPQPPYGGTFAVVGNTIQFMPAAGVSETTVTGSYTVADTNRLVSNVGYLSVFVNSAVIGWTTLDSFESGADGWGPGPSPTAGTVAWSPMFATDGQHSLQVNVTAGGWFGVTFPSPVNLSDWPSLALDVTTTTVGGGNSAFAFQSGSNGEWCQNAAFSQNLPLFTTTTVTLPLQASSLTCYNGAPDLTNVKALYVYLGVPGTYYLDNLRAAPGSAGSAPAPVITGIGNSEGGQSGASANTYVSIYGSNFAPAGWPVPNWIDYVFNGQLPTRLAGVSVSMGGTPAYIEYVSSGQINVLAPALGTGNMSVTVTTPAGISVPFSTSSAAVQPAFFVWPGSQVVATDANYNKIAQSGSLPAATSAPAQPGEIIILWGTGFGPTTPAAPSGQEVPPNSYSVNGVTVTLGSTAATVLGTALSPGLAGVYQVAITVPSGLANGDYPIVATVGGVQTPPLTLTVQQ